MSFPIKAYWYIKSRFRRNIIGPTKSTVRNLRTLRMERFNKTTDKATEKSVSQSSLTGFVIWNQPNRGDALYLHIGKSGGRDSTVTGVCWLDDRYFVANHRCGLRVAVFDKDNLSKPVSETATEFLTDAVGAYKVDEATWQIALSGCWTATALRYTLRCDDGFSFELAGTRPQKSRDFCHGTSFDAEGRLLSAINTGVDPRIEIGDQVTRLPKPWGARQVTFDAERSRYVTVAVSADAQRHAYRTSKTMLFTLAPGDTEWTPLALYKDVHSDCLVAQGAFIWFPDQLQDRVFGVDAMTGDVVWLFKGDAFDFPHGIDVSETGCLAVTNYGTSSVALMDLNTLLSG